MAKYPKLRERDVIRIQWQDAGGSNGWWTPTLEEMAAREKEYFVTDVGHFLRFSKKGIWMSRGYTDERDGKVSPPRWPFRPTRMCFKGGGATTCQTMISA